MYPLPLLISFKSIQMHNRFLVLLLLCIVVFCDYIAENYFLCYFCNPICHFYVTDLLWDRVYLLWWKNNPHIIDSLKFLNNLMTKIQKNKQKTCPCTFLFLILALLLSSSFGFAYNHVSLIMKIPVTFFWLCFYYSREKHPLTPSFLYLLHFSNKHMKVAWTLRSDSTHSS